MEGAYKIFDNPLMRTQWPKKAQVILRRWNQGDKPQVLRVLHHVAVVLNVNADNVNTEACPDHTTNTSFKRLAFSNLKRHGYLQMRAHQCLRPCPKWHIVAKTCIKRSVAPKAHASQGCIASNSDAQDKEHKARAQSQKPCISLQHNKAWVCPQTAHVSPQKSKACI